MLWCIYRHCDSYEDRNENITYLASQLTDWHNQKRAIIFSRREKHVNINLVFVIFFVSDGLRPLSHVTRDDFSILLTGTRSSRASQAVDACRTLKNVYVEVVWVLGLPKGPGESRFSLPFSLPSFPFSPETPDTQVTWKATAVLDLEHTQLRHTRDRSTGAAFFPVWPGKIGLARECCGILAKNQT